MAVLPKWAGMFFMSVIMGGSVRKKNKKQKNKGGKNGQAEGGNSAISICVTEKSSQVRSAPGVRLQNSPGENKIEMHKFIHNNAPTGFTCISIIHHCAITLGCYVAQRGVLTVDCNLNLALIRRSHSIVGDAFVVLGLLPLNLYDV